MLFYRCFILFALSIFNVIAAPVENSLVKRQSRSSTLHDKIVDIYNQNVDKTSSDIKAEFTGKIIDHLSTWPDAAGWNILIYHLNYNDKDPILCTADNNGYFADYELPTGNVLGIQTTYGYRVVLLSDGSINMNGNDGGYDNWRMTGPSVHFTAGQGYATFGDGCPSS